jgi:hypothetical protein
MSRKLKLLERVLVVRERMRDAASAATNLADAKRQAAELAHETAKNVENALLEAAPERFESATTIDELMTFDAERVLSQHIANDAAKNAKIAHDEAEKMRAVLRSRARDVRIFEKAIDDVRGMRASHEMKREQTAADDLSSWRNAG